MQKQAGQARGNQDLEITKNLVKPTKEGESKPDIEAAIGYNALSRNENDPASNLGSSRFDPSQDPALRPEFNI